MSNRTELKIDILKFGRGSKKKKKRHPAGGYYWGPDWPEGTPKQYTPKSNGNSSIMNA